MNIASVTITLNDYLNLESWNKYYLNYKSALKYHIIVDNGSQDEYIDQLEKTFVNSIIIKRNNNGGTTAAYNDGIKYLLSLEDVDSIFLLANDIEISSNDIYDLNQKLFVLPKAGIIAPILFKKNSNIIENFGSEILRNFRINRILNGTELNDDVKKLAEVDMVSGGANLAKTEVYKIVGLQDESLFMYGDETDYHFRVKQAGYKIYVSSEFKAWHQHVNLNNNKYASKVTYYYHNRNMIILNYKYRKVFEGIKIFFFFFFLRFPVYFIGFIKNKEISKAFYYQLGLLAGLINYKKNWVKL